MKSRLLYSTLVVFLVNLLVGAGWALAGDLDPWPR